MAGKGDRYRHVDPKKWEEGWKKSFDQDWTEHLPVEEMTQEEKDKLLQEKMTNNMKADDLND